MNKVYTLRGLMLLILSTSASCSSVRPIGDINMISNRNIDSKTEYVSIKTYAGGGKEIKKSKAKSLQEAVDQTVRNVPDGEFIRNAKAYIIDNKYFAVEGDVWGQGQGNYKGFHIGDKVQWRTITGTKTGVVRGFVDNQRCMIQEEGKTIASEEQFDKLRKID